MYLQNPPKDSFMYMATQVSDAAKGALRTTNALMSFGDTNVAVENHIMNTLTRTPATVADVLNYYLWMISVQTYLSSQARPKDYVMDAKVCALLHRSGMMDVPYSQFSTDTPITYVDISASDLEFKCAVAAQDGSARLTSEMITRKIAGGIVLNMSLVTAPLKSALINTLRTHGLSDPEGLMTLTSGYVIMLTLSGPIFEPYSTVLLLRPNIIGTDGVRESLGEIMMGRATVDTAIPEDDIITRGVALDMIVKSVIFLKTGEFNEESVSFGPRLKAAPSAKGRKGPTPPQGGKYRVTYVNEQSGGHGLSWLPDEADTDLVTAAVEDANLQLAEDTVEEKARRAPQFIPDHIKLIWVTDEYVHRKGLRAEDIIESGEVPRRGKSGNIITKTRHLIAKDFVYGYGITKPAPESDTLRVGLRKVPGTRNPFDIY